MSKKSGFGGFLKGVGDLISTGVTIYAAYKISEQVINTIQENNARPQSQRNVQNQNNQGNNEHNSYSNSNQNYDYPEYEENLPDSESENSNQNVKGPKNDYKSNAGIQFI